MSTWSAFISLLEPATVALVGGVVALFAVIPLVLQAYQLRSFFQSLLMAACTMALAGFSLLNYSFSAGELNVNHQSMTTAVTGVACFLSGLLSFLLAAYKTMPWRSVMLLIMVCVTGFVLTGRLYYITLWANLCQFLIASLGMILVLRADTLRSRKMKGFLVALCLFVALGAVLTLSDLMASVDLATPNESLAAPEAMRIAALMKAVMPILSYACIVAVIQGKIADRLQANLNQDSLTGAYSRHFLFEKGSELLRQPREPGQKLAALVLIDLNNFKSVNTRWGHSIANQVLQHCAQSIRQAVGSESCLVGRFVGEEFYVLMPKASGFDASALAERVRMGLALCPYRNGHIKIDLTVTIGYAQHPTTTSVDALVALADADLYRAKRNQSHEMFAFNGLLVPV
jgi:diguanylate cyclase (GGDEF)-like protein